MGNSGSLLFLLILSLFSLMLSWYVFQALRTITTQWDNPTVRTSVSIGYWVLTSLYIILTLLSFLTISRTGKIAGYPQMGINLFLTVTVTKFTVIIFLLGEDFVRGIQGAANYLTGNLSPSERYIPQRRKFISQIALVAASIPFAGFVYGVFRGKYNFKVFR